MIIFGLGFSSSYLALSSLQRDIGEIPQPQLLFPFFPLSLSVSASLFSILSLEMNRYSIENIEMECV